jgi:hypothetical protein
VKSVTDNRGVRQHYYGYDAAGRVTQDFVPRIDVATGVASGYSSIYYAYNPRGQLTNMWGDVPNPVKYDYDTTTGDRTAQTTYRGGTSWSQSDLVASGWPSGGDVTLFGYYAETGLLKNKTDALNRAVNFTYNIRGQTVTATSSRSIVRHYDYYESGGSATGELKQVSYTGEPSGLLTSAVSYTYDRLGRAKTVSDGTGDRTFTYRASDLQLDTEQFGRLNGATTNHVLGAAPAARTAST